MCDVASQKCLKTESWMLVGHKKNIHKIMFLLIMLHRYTGGVSISISDKKIGREKMLFPVYCALYMKMTL